MRLEEWAPYIKSIGSDVKSKHHEKRDGDGATTHQKFTRNGKTLPEVGFAAITHDNGGVIKIWARLSYGNKYSVNTGWAVVQSDADVRELNWMKVNLPLAYERAYYSKCP